MPEIVLVWISNPIEVYCYPLESWNIVKTWHRSFSVFFKPFERWYSAKVSAASGKMEIFRSNFQSMLRIGSLPVLIYAFDHQTFADSWRPRSVETWGQGTSCTCVFPILDWVTMEVAKLEELIQIGWHKQPYAFLGKYMLLITPGWRFWEKLTLFYGVELTQKYARENI